VFRFWPIAELDDDVAANVANKSSADDEVPDVELSELVELLGPLGAPLA